MNLVSRNNLIDKLSGFLDLELSDLSYSVRVSCKTIHSMLDNNYPVEVDSLLLIKILNRVMKSMENLFLADQPSLEYKMRKEYFNIKSLIEVMNNVIDRVLNSNGINESLFKNSSKFIDFVSVRDGLMYLVYD